MNTAAMTAMTQFKPIERVQALADISRSGYIVIATNPVHRLQIRPIVHNQRASPLIIPPTCIRVRVQYCVNAARDRQTHRLA